MNPKNENLPYGLGHKFGHLLNTLLKNPFLFPIGLLLSIPILLIIAVHKASLFFYNYYAYHIFQRQFHNTRKFIYFAYSEQHQYDWFFGEGGTLRSIEPWVASDNWRKSWDSYQQESEKGERGTAFEVFSFKRWRISNMRTQLPFFVVFTRRYIPKEFQASEAYRKRFRDKRGEINKIEQEILHCVFRNGLTKIQDKEIL